MMAAEAKVLVAGLAVLAGLIFYASTRIGRRPANYPPGPPTKPFIGNLHQLPKTGGYLWFHSLRKRYGPIIHLKFGPGDIVVLQSAKVVKDLIDKKSSIYSSRPDFHIVQNLIADNAHPLFMPYGKEWQRLRKIMHSHFSAEKCKKEHLYVQNAEAVEVLYDFLHRPESWYDHSKRFSTSVSTTLLYGVRGPVYSHWAVKGIFDAMDRWGELLEVGATPPVDLVPILKYTPSFAAPWKKEAAYLRNMMNSLYGGLWQQSKERHIAGDHRVSLADQLVADQAALGLSDHQISFLLGVLLEGGSDTTAGSILTFLLAMIHKPEVQKRAQAEIDSVISEDSTPTWEDWEDLPYVRAIQKEVLRWRPVLPVGVAHSLQQDDTYEGMVIPKGATVLLNTWGLNHDPDKWGEDVDEFNPDRFLSYPLLASDYANSSDYKLRDHHAFGAGRRICPGIHLAERNLFLEMAKLLWAFDFSSPINPKTGKPFEVDVSLSKFTTGNVARPYEFPLKVTVRSEKRARTIDRERAEAVHEVFSKFPETPKPANFPY